MEEVVVVGKSTTGFWIKLFERALAGFTRVSGSRRYVRDGGSCGLLRLSNGCLLVVSSSMGVKRLDDGRDDAVDETWKSPLAVGADIRARTCRDRVSIGLSRSGNRSQTSADRGRLCAYAPTGVRTTL